MPIKKIATALILILIIAGGAAAGIVLIQQRTEVREKAAVPDGSAESSIFPTSGSFDVGDSFPVSVYFNTANIAVNGVVVRLTYPFTGVTPEIVASDITINSVLISTGDWTCPTQDVAQSGGVVNIDISCSNLAEGGFSASTDTLLASFNLTVEREPAANPTVVRFDPTASRITQLSTGQDILLIPQSEGSYSIGSGTVTPTITVTQTTTPTVTTAATATPTLKATATPVSTTSAVTVTPTTAPLPDAGVSTPTIFGISLGMLAIFGALLLAL